MKKALALMAVTTLGFAAAASADVVFNLGDFTVEADANGPINTVEFNLGVVNNVVGYSFSGTASGISGNGTWASDTRMAISLDGGSPWRVGGLTTTRDEDWDFQGSPSDLDGFYSHGPSGAISGSGEWTFTFTHDWHSGLSDPITWSDVQITLHTIPAPGALALLGFVGLLGGRRRR